MLDHLYETWYFLDIDIRSYVIVLAKYGIILDHDIVYIFLEFRWRWNMCTSKKRSIQDLSPGSECLQGHLRWCHYFIRYYTTLLKPNLLYLKPTLFVWIYQGSTLYPKKCFLQMPTDCCITCGCTTCTRKCSCRYSNVECTEYCKCGENFQKYFLNWISSY